MTVGTGGPFAIGAIGYFPRRTRGRPSGEASQRRRSLASVKGGRPPSGRGSEQDDSDRHPGHELEQHARDHVPPLDRLPRAAGSGARSRGSSSRGPANRPVHASRGTSRSPPTLAPKTMPRPPDPNRPKIPSSIAGGRPVGAGLGGHVGPAVGARPADVHHRAHRLVDERDAHARPATGHDEQQDVTQPRVGACPC